MNLITDQWIPVSKTDGTNCLIAPWEIGASENPVIDINAPRADFRGALYQFLIGLVQTAFAPVDYDQWEEQWNTIPSCSELKSAFGKFTDAFELTNENGPAFMQDYAMPSEGKPIHIRQLLFEIAGNPEHFVKHNTINSICECCAAAALFSLQTNAPEGGRGHRTGMRGGGPLTTIVSLLDSKRPLWDRVWLNVLNADIKSGKLPVKLEADIFPWMGKTRESKNDFKTYPEDVNKLQMYWGLPRRIRLVKGECQKICDICGKKAPEIVGFYMECHGVCYGSTWVHSLSPYRTNKEKDGTQSYIALKGKNAGYSYPDWLALTMCNNENDKAALVVRDFNEKKRYFADDVENTAVWCFGHDMKQMKARCWYDQTVPLVILTENKRAEYVNKVNLLIMASIDVVKILREQIKAAWFERPKDAKGDTSIISSAFYEETEDAFFKMAEKLRSSIESGQPTNKILTEWRDTIIKSAEKLFDRFALQNTDEPKNMRRIAEAANTLSNDLKSKKIKTIHALSLEGK